VKLTKANFYFPDSQNDKYGIFLETVIVLKIESV
jgi:hypothetical protein